MIVTLFCCGGYNIFINMSKKGLAIIKSPLFFWVGIILGGFLVYGFFLAQGLYKDIPLPCKKGFSCAYGLFYYNETASFPGYTLINPRRSNIIYLINWKGNIVHSWKLNDLPSQKEILSNPLLFHLGTMQTKLLPNGNLLVGSGEPRSESSDNSTVGSMAELRELDWDGNTVWKYRNSAMHHDFERLPDGRTALIVWENLSKEFSSKIKGGVEGTEYNGGVMHADAIIEVDKNGNELWRWSIKDYLDPEAPENALDPDVARNTWNHTDALVYIEENSITQKPAYLISINNLDALVMVERESGKIIWRWGDDYLGGQHSAALTNRGTVVTFDTGKYRNHFKTSRNTTPLGYILPYSQIVEVNINPPSLRGIFVPGPQQPVRSIFYSPFNGSVQALPNGNILVSAGIRGRIFEVDLRNRKVVWDYISPFGPMTAEWPGVIENSVFSAYRYSPDYTDQFKKLKLK